MWGKELTTCFLGVSVGVGSHVSAWIFLVKGLSTSNFDSFLRCTVKKVTRSYSEPGCSPLSFDQLEQTTWVWRYGFPSFGETPFVGRLLSKIAPPSNASRKDLKLATQYIHIYTPENYHSPCKMMVGRQLSVSKGPFFRGHVNFVGDVTCLYEI